MKRSLLLSALALTLGVLSASAGELVLAKDGKSDYRIVAAPGNFNHCNVYLHGEGPDDRRLFRAYYLPTPKNDEWQRDFSSMWSKEGKRVLTKLADARSRKISFFFRRIDRTAEIYLGMIGDTTINVSEVPPWCEGHEAE